MMLIRRAIVVLAILFAKGAWAQTPGAGGGSGTAAAPGGSPPAAAPAPSGAPAPAPAAAPTPVAAPVPTPAPGAQPAAPAAPIPSAGTELTAEPVKPAGGTVVGGGAGLSPNLPQVTGGTGMSNRQAEEMTPSTGGGADEWKFQFHGYFRAPLRASWGPPTPAQQPSIYYIPTGAMDPRPPGSYVAPYHPGATPPSGTQLHGTPRVPGYNYNSFEYTNTIGGPWSQLNFSYGNARVMGTVIVDAYNQTDGGYRNLQAQQGIDQVFLTMNLPEAFGDRGGLVWTIGSFANRYGVAGKYDAGMYETYLFGRTHISGSTWTANLSNLDAAGDWSLILEGGIGAKLDIVPFLNNQNYQVFMNIPIAQNQGSPYLSDRSPDFLPYAGQVPLGSTYLHHEHAVAKYRNLLTFGLHYIFTWTPDDNWSAINSRQIDRSMGTSQSGLPQSAVPRARGPIQGSMEVWGGEVKLSGGAFGDGYLGYSHVDARNIAALADTLEVIHSNGGSQLKQAYFGRSFNGHSGVYDGPQNETGTIDTISFQYAFSFGSYAKYPEEFWGDGTDLVLTAFAFLSIVDSKAPPIALSGDTATGVIGDPNRAHTWDMSTKKLKFGADAIYTPLSWLGLGARFDAVKPDLDAAYSRTPASVGVLQVDSTALGNPGGSQLNFYALAARAVFKSEFLTHETITLVYAHYLLGKGAYPAYPYEWVAKADADAVSLSATLWW